MSTQQIPDVLPEDVLCVCVMDMESLTALQQNEAGTLQLLSNLEASWIVESSPVDPAAVRSVASENLITDLGSRVLTRLLMSLVCTVVAYASSKYLWVWDPMANSPAGMARPIWFRYWWTWVAQAIETQTTSRCRASLPLISQADLCASDQ